MSAPAPVRDPFVFAIPGGLFPGRMLRLQGSTPADARSFQVHLQAGPEIGNSDIMLSMTFHITDSTVALNHNQNRLWGTEERQGGSPVVAGHSFEMILLCEQQTFKIALNGKPFHETRHRMPFQSITHVAAEGQMKIGNVAIADPPPP